MTGFLINLSLTARHWAFTRCLINRWSISLLRQAVLQTPRSSAQQPSKAFIRREQTIVHRSSFCWIILTFLALLLSYQDTYADMWTQAFYQFLDARQFFIAPRRPNFIRKFYARNCARQASIERNDVPINYQHIKVAQSIDVRRVGLLRLFLTRPWFRPFES